ncbi:hypothetical protein EZV62_024653 [Acer yangbiense]|uniref:DUF4283 domain-containing protein n=1 Tax=Acer yangbiense TaxID=1000413 RepID=A0A5C7GVP4_9ROSI|nr:hypothetical protein EZV62_024653 [Acer yangbiense]
MNADELAMLCGALSVKEKERPVRTLDNNLIDKGAQRLSLCLVGKVFASKLVNRAAFIDVMTSVWRVNEGVKLNGLKDIGLFLSKMIGEVSEIDMVSAREGNGRYIRVRVVIDVNKPLIRLGHSMRECTDIGDIKDVTSEANMRLNVWLRTVSPPKKFPQRNGRYDHGSWGRHSRNAANYSGRNNNSRFRDKWYGKNITVEDVSSGER